MKRYPYLNALLVSFLFLLASCSSLTLGIKDHSPAAEQSEHTQAMLTTIQTTPEKKPNLLARLLKKYRNKISAIFGLLWLWLLARLYGNEKRRRVPGWHLEDLALLKIIKDNATRIWNHHRPGKTSSGWRIGENNRCDFNLLG